MEDNRPAAYYEGDVLIIRASSIGSTCLWELVAAAQGYEPSDVPADLQRAFDEGHRLEPIIIGMLEAEGYVVTGAQDEGHLDITPTLRIRYHPDGFISNPVYNVDPPQPPGMATRILEVKTMSNDSWQRAARGSVGDIFAEYNWQISVMMWANEIDAFAGDPSKWYMPALWVGYNKGNADGSECLDQGRLLYEPIVRPPISLDTIYNKALAVQQLVEDDDIVMSGRPCDDPSHYPCRYLFLRPTPVKESTKYIPPPKG